MKNFTKEKVLVLFSGGIDSSVCAAKLKQEGFDVHALTFANKNKAEVSCSKQVVHFLNINHVIVDVSCFNILFSSIPNMKFAVGGAIGGCVPEKMESAPMSVEVMHTIAAMYASTHGIKRIFWAIHGDDLQNSSSFFIENYLKKMEEIIQMKTGDCCKFETPFMEMRKIDVALLGETFGLPIGITFSCCAEVNGLPCKKCEQCVKREEVITQITTGSTVAA